MNKVYAVWFRCYDDQHIEGPLYRSKQKADQECERLNKIYETEMAKYGLDRKNHYSVEQHIVE